MGQKNNTAKAGEKLEDLTPAELIAKIEELNASLETAAAEAAEASEKLAASEAMLNEALDKIDLLENRVKTGEINVGHDGAFYRVIPAKLGTLGHRVAIGSTTVPAEDLHKYPELIADYIGMKSGFLQLKED